MKNNNQLKLKRKMMLQKNATKALLDDASLQKNFSGDKEGR